MRTLNLGILAHVDAGKTTLTERLLHAAGVIDAVGSVDDGTTQTDSLALERQRGITISSAVVSFAVNDVTVNLIDTPGHPDFIAEVERVLGVLDGAVLVISAVEGVQAQTRILMRALQRLRIPTLIFINKIDRRGAQCERVLQSIRERLGAITIAMGAVHDQGTRAADFAPYGAADTAFTALLAEVLADHDDALLASYVDAATSIPYGQLHEGLGAHTRKGWVHPVFFGSAATGAGVDSLIAGATRLLPATEPDVDGPAAGTVFKIERGARGEKIAYVRLFSGRVRVRDRVRLRATGDKQKVTDIWAFDGGLAQPASLVAAGQIGKLWGLRDAQVGDMIGAPGMASEPCQFAPPALEAVIVPRRPSDKGALRVALGQLAEQDPLINLRQDDIRQEMCLTLYGEVQKQVVQETLANDFAIEVEFRESTPICIERPIGVGAAVEVLGKADNPFLATVGLRIEPAAIDAGVQLRMEVDVGSMPLFIYGTTDGFSTAIDDTVRRTLRQGLYGWRVCDCTVTVTRSGYRSPESTAGDFRKLTPLVLMSALKRAGTAVCEPIHRFRLEIPTDALGLTLTALAGLQAVPEAPVAQGPACTLEGQIPAARVHELQQQLPGLTRGEGVLESALDCYRPVRGMTPSRARTDNNPLNRREYLQHIMRRI